MENLKYIRDPTKKFKYLFPFYRMNIETLDYKLDQVYFKANSSVKDTELIHLKEVKKIFCTTPAWKRLWPNVEVLLKLPVFKEITIIEK